MVAGFVMTRHVNSEASNRYWNESYRCIRRYFPEAMVMIVDDSSIYHHVKPEEDIRLTNVMIVQSEFPRAGEILAYYYFYKYRPFERAIIIHDSVFLQEAVNLTTMDGVRYIWHFMIHSYDDPHTETMLLGKLQNTSEVMPLYHEKRKWHGCFGAQAVIDLNFLCMLEAKYNLFSLIPIITNRKIRYALERILACIFTFERPFLRYEPSFFGCIYNHQPWGYTFDDYDKNHRKHEKAIVKVWSGR